MNPLVSRLDGFLCYIFTSLGEAWERASWLQPASCMNWKIRNWICTRYCCEYPIRFLNNYHNIISLLAKTNYTRMLILLLKPQNLILLDQYQGICACKQRLSSSVQNTVANNPLADSLEWALIIMSCNSSSSSLSPHCFPSVIRLSTSFLPPSLPFFGYIYPGFHTNKIKLLLSLPVEKASKVA